MAASFVRFDRWIPSDSEEPRPDPKRPNFGGFVYIDVLSITAIIDPTGNTLMGEEASRKTFIRAGRFAHTVNHPAADVLVSVDKVLNPQNYGKTNDTEQRNVPA